MRIELKELINTAEILEDKIIYNQRDILFGVLSSMFADNKAMTEMHNRIYWNFHTVSFKKLIGKEDEELEIPSYATMIRVIINVYSGKMEEILRRYFIPRVELKEYSQVAVDGKMMNGSGRKRW